MQKRTISLTLCMLVGLSSLYFLFKTPGVRAWSGYSNDYITDNYDNTVIDNAYNLTLFGPNSTDAHSAQYNYHALNVSSADPQDYFNITIFKCQELDGLVTSPETLKLNISFYTWEGYWNNLGYADWYDPVLGGYPFNSSGVVTQDMTVYVNVTRLDTSTAPDDTVYNIDLKVIDAVSDWNVTAGHSFVYEQEVWTDEHSNSELTFYNVSVVGVSWATLGSPYLDQTNTIYATVYNRSTPLCTDPWVVDDTILSPDYPIMTYNACGIPAGDTQARFFNFTNWFLFLPQVVTPDLVNYSILNGMGIWNDPEVVDATYSVDTTTGYQHYELHALGAYALTESYDWTWDSNGVLVEFNHYNASTSWYRLKLNPTFTCIDCNCPDTPTWGVGAGDERVWRVDDGHDKFQLKMAVHHINLTYFAPEDSQPWGGWCSNYSLVFADMYNRTDDCEAPWVHDTYIWIPQLPDSWKNPGPVAVYNSCQPILTSWLSWSHGDESEQHMPPFLVIPTPVNLDLVKKMMEQNMGGALQSITTTGNRLDFTMNDQESGFVTGFMEYGADGVLVHQKVYNATKVLLEITSDPCKQGEPGNPTQNPTPNPSLPPEASPLDVVEEWSVPAGTIFSGNVSISGITLTVDLEVTSEVNVTFGIWKEKPVDPEPGFKSGTGAIYFLVEVSNASAIKGNITVTVDLPTGIDTSLPADEIAALLQIVTLSGSEWKAETGWSISVDKTAGTATITLQHLSVFALGVKDEASDLSLDIPGFSTLAVLFSALGAAAMLVRKRVRA
ncbi:MAG: hypothetical protein ACTSU5_20885 [Promethearchaeota archaeon]